MIIVVVVVIVTVIVLVMVIGTSLHQVIIPWGSPLKSHPTFLWAALLTVGLDQGPDIIENGEIVAFIRRRGSHL